jgi:hypothetical protein
MFEIGRQQRLALTTLGGVLVPLAWVLWETARAYVGVAVVVPVLLGFGLIEIHARYGDSAGSTGRAGVVLTAIGLALLALSILAYVAAPPTLVLVFILALPVVAGVVTLVLGSGLLAIALHRIGLLSMPAAICLALGAPLAPLLPIALDPLLGGAAPRGLSPVLAGLPYGVGWVLTAHELRTTERQPVDRHAADSGIGAHSLAAGVVGVTYLALGAGWLLPLGPISGTPWVGNSTVLDAFHLVAGLAGVFVGTRGDAQRARTYAKVVGSCSLSIVVAFPVGLAVGFEPLFLSVIGIVPYLPAGLVLAPLGFLVDTDESAD